MYLLNNTLLGEHVADRVHSNSNYKAAIRWILESHSKLNNIVSPVTSLKCYKQNTECFLILMALWIEYGQYTFG